MNIIAALLIFTIIVVAHELGHFLLAKKNGVGVPEFSIGMGPRIITLAKTTEGIKIKLFCSQKLFETREDWQEVTKYSWKLFPIGGSCAMIGEDEENNREDSFSSKGIWARFSVIFAGPFFNFIFAFIIAIIILANAGIDYPIVEYVYDNQPAQTAGIQVGDRIKKINGHKIAIGREINTYINAHPLPDKDVPVVLERDGKEMELMLSPKYKTYLFGFTYSQEQSNSTKILAVDEKKAFGKAGIKENDKIISINGTKVSSGKEIASVIQKNNDGREVSFVIERDGKERLVKVKPEPYEANILGLSAIGDHKADNAMDVLKYSVIEVKYWIVTTISNLGQLITGKLSVKNLSGPVGIVDTVDSVINQSSSYGMKAVIMNLLYMAVLLSANLGVMNLLPIPALDGGRLLFILIEAIRRKPVDKEKEGYVHLAGFVLLMLLTIFVMYNDIIRIIK